MPDAIRNSGKSKTRIIAIGGDRYFINWDFRLNGIPVARNGGGGSSGSCRALLVTKSEFCSLSLVIKMTE